MPHSHGRRPRLLLPALALAIFISTGSGRQEPVPRIEWSDLPASIVAKSPDLRTGYLVVPERRFPAGGSPTIRLPFIIMKSRSSNPRPDPVLFTAGGPGGSTLLGVRSRSRHPLLEDRDVILFEQRGTRFAQPALLGEGVAEALRSGWGSRLNGDPDPAAVERALAAMRRDFEVQGIDPAAYTTRESAADIAALRELLKIESWNLYGASYGTKLMLTVLRDHPAGVRSVILDSVLPPEANWDEEAPANILEALGNLLQAARAEESLKPRLAGLEERLSRTLAEANVRPVQVLLKNPLDRQPLTIRLDAAGIMNCVYAGLEDPGMIPRLPMIVDAASRGDMAVLAPLAQSYLASSQGFAWGMRLAVWGNEELPFERPEKIEHPAGVGPELDKFVQTAVPIEALRVWLRGQPAPRENEPVTSGVPILIASGEFDPDTPVKWARGAAAHLPHSQIVVFAGMTHVPLFSHPEAPRIMKAFLADPSRLIEVGGAAKRRPFLTSLEGR